MHVYLDESGDLGFSFDRPYRQGGSSRYLTICALIIPKKLCPLPKRIVKKIYKKNRKPRNYEIKGKDLSQEDIIFVIEQILRLVKIHSSIKIIAITVNKNKVKDHIRSDPNKLYTI